VALAINDEPELDDEELEQDALRIFIEDILVEPLDDRVLGVSEGGEGMELVFR